jgi:hypothetical protein
VARARAAAGETWILLAAPGSWPPELRDCHTGLVLPGHGADPRSLVDAGPPPALAGWLRSAAAGLGPGPLRVLAEVSQDTLARYLDLLAHDTLGDPADRYVFGPDLDGLYADRIEDIMNRSVQGIAGASVRREPFSMRRRSTLLRTTHNLVAHLPGSAPGTGTFVVCGHVDATGSNDPAWRDAVQDTLATSVPTPGAEDNASGVASVLEVLRVVADGVRQGDLDFAFDLEFIAFSGEEVAGAEQGLLGSTRYVEARTDSGVTLLGAINLDMVGYVTPLGGLPDRLQLVHNPASRWLVEEVVVPAAAAAGVTLPLVPELDEARASDHNSFWNVNAPAILCADAPVSALRNYPTYHRPNDLPELVRTDKLVQVARVLAAALGRFDTGAHSEPRLLFAPEDLFLTTLVQGTEFRYIPGYHQLWPGTPLRAQLFVHSLGATYSGPLRVELATLQGGRRSPVYDREETVTVPTGTRVAVAQDVPIASQGGGLQVLEARVTWTPPGQTPVVQTARDSFFVRDRELQVTVLPNPVRDAGSIRLRVNRPGDLLVEIYSLEGERVLSSRQRVPAPDAAPRDFIADVPLAGAGVVAGELASGSYIVRARILDGGESGSSLARLVIVK